MPQTTLNIPRETTHQRIADALEDIVNKIVDVSDADNVNYDNTTSGLSASKVQGAIDELASEKSDITYVDTEISKAISSCYHPSGSKTVAELTSALLVSTNEGNVYDMTTSGTTTSDFKEGAGYPIRVGDNVGICNVGTQSNPVYKFDLLSGFVDLSNYYTKTESDSTFVAKESGKALSTNDYTTAEQTKLAGIEAGAQKNHEYYGVCDSLIDAQTKAVTISGTTPTFEEGDILYVRFQRANTKFTQIKLNINSTSDINVRSNATDQSGACFWSSNTVQQFFYHVNNGTPEWVMLGQGSIILGLGLEFNKSEYVYNNTGVLNVTQSTQDGCVKVSKTSGNTDVPIKGYSTLATKVSEHDYDLARSEYVEYSDVSTFNQAAPINALKVETKIEPDQDLHGYDKPWVGGAGKNLFKTTLVSQTKDNVTYIVNDDGSINVSGRPSSYANVDIGEAIVNSSMGTVTFSAFSDSSNMTIDLLKLKDSNNLDLYTYENNTNPITINLSNYPTVVKIAFSVKRMNNGVQCSGVIKPQIEIGSTSTSFAPYTNICPISGRSEVNVDRVGKNLCEGRLTGRNIGANGAIGSTAEYDMCYGKIIQGVTYTITTDDQFVSGYFTDIPSDTSTSYNGQRIVTNNNTFTAPIDGYVAFRTLTGYATPQLEKGSTATTYQPYQGKTYTIHLGQDVYGGTLDVTSGELVVDRGYFKPSIFNANNITDYDISVFSIIPNRYKTALGLISNIAVPVISSESAIAQYGLICSLDSSNTNYIVKFYASREKFGLSSYSDLSDLLLNNNVEICYELYSPFTIHLTPQQIKLLQGTNTVYSDSGDIYIEYQPDNAIGEAVRIVENEYDSKIGSLSVLNGMLCMTFNE